MAPAAGVRPLIGANWKMELTPSETDRALAGLLDLVADLSDRDLYVLPSYPALAVAQRRLTGTGVAWGAQDVHPEDRGAHTGDVSAPMLADLGCHYVMIGHTERRRDHGEGPELLAAKAAAVVRWGMVPIICVGDREPVGPAAATHVVLDDLDRILVGLDPIALPGLVVAYEPAWAIGQGSKPAHPADVGEVQRTVRAWLEARGLGGPGTRVIYGGSVDESAAAEVLDQPGVDGLFVGRASVDPVRFAAIARVPVRPPGGVTAPARS
jgi:triosephosphate isomerase